MILHRTTPPEGDPIEISKGVWVSDGPPRTIEGATPEDARRALTAAGARIWGEHWQPLFRDAFGLRSDTVRDWHRRDQIPPGQLLGWIALINASPNYRSIGAHLVGHARGDGAQLAAAIFAKL